MSTVQHKNKRLVGTRGHHGIQHLATTIITLAAILLALSIYAFYYQRKVRQSPGNANAPKPQVVVPTDDKPLADTPIGTRTFNGTIKTVSGDRISVVTLIATNGIAEERTVTVIVSDRTSISQLGPIPVGIPIASATVPERQRVQVDRTKLTVGSTVTVTTDGVSDRSPVTAETIGIESTS